VEHLGLAAPALLRWPEHLARVELLVLLLARGGGEPTTGAAAAFPPVVEPDDDVDAVPESVPGARWS